MKLNNVFGQLPKDLQHEVFEQIVSSESIKIERIVSKGHRTEEGSWYDQKWAEWVLLLQGAARLEFEDGTLMDLNAGDYLNIPAHCRHRVVWTMPDEESIWLAIHYPD